MKLKLLSIAILGILFLQGCVPYDQESFQDFDISFLDSNQQKIYDFQNFEQKDSLIACLSNANPAVRLIAAQAFASVQDSASIDTLAVLLYDEEPEIRVAAAYALGQTRARGAAPLLAAAFRQEDTAGVYRLLNSTILEAVGKCGGPEYLAFLSTIQTYTPADTLLLVGQCKGLYRFALRKMTNPKGTDRMVFIAQDKTFPKEARFWAAHYLARAADLNLKPYTGTLAAAFQSEEDAAIRMALATAMGKTDPAQSMPIIREVLVQERDYRVRCNLIRTLRKYPQDSVETLILNSVKDSIQHVSALASEYFLEKGIAREASTYYQLALDADLPSLTKITLLRAALRHLPGYYKNTRYQVITELEKTLEDSKNPYVKARVIQALSEYPWNYTILADMMRGNGSIVLQTAAIEGVAHICRHPKFDAFFGEKRRMVRKELADILIEAIQTGDAGIMAIAAGVFSQSSIDFKRIISDFGFLEQAIEKLELPREIETLYELENARAYFAGEQPPKKMIPEPNHKIRWDLIEMMNAETRATIHTNKGKVVLSFFIDEAPGSVANFIELARNGFYNRKAFHRVVPNFVVQGGCPRGDGFGSLDYSIRSELPQLYYDQEGMVGMASAGIHTEGVQFFITHSPTPHLDGRYTIFARVESGMDVVHSIEMGDTIEKIVIQ